MAIKRIIVRGSHGRRDYKWWDTDGDMIEEGKGKIGHAKKLADAIELAKAHAGGSSQTVDIKDWN